MCVGLYVYVFVYVCLRMSVVVCARMYRYTCVCFRVYVYTCVCVFTYVCDYMYEYV